MKTEQLIKRCDQVMAFAIYVMIFFLPISSAVLESFFGVAFLAFIIKRIALYRCYRKEREAGRAPQSVGSRLWQYVKVFKPIQSPLNRFLAWYALAVFISFIFSQYHGTSLKGFFFKFLEEIYLFFFFVEAINSRKRLKIFISVLLVSFSLITVDGIYQYFARNDFIQHHPVTDGRITASFKHANDLAGYLVMSLPLWLSLVLSSVFWGKKYGKETPGQFFESWQFKIIAGVIFLAASFVLGVTFSRAAWFAFSFSVLVLLILRPKFFIIGIMCVVVFLSAFFAEIKSSRPKDEMRSGLLDDSGRLTYWQEAIGIIQDYPLFGSGLNTYSKIAPDYKIIWGGYPHNCYLQMAAEIGVIGLTAFLLVVFQLFRNSWRAVVSSTDRFLSSILWGGLMGLLAFLFHSFFDTNFYAVQLSCLLWIMIGFVISVGQLAKKL